MTSQWGDIAIGGGFNPYGPQSLAQEYRTFGQRQFAPATNRRVLDAFYAARDPLQAQYYLAEPRLGGDSFTDFLTLMGSAPTYNPYGDRTLRERAEQANFLANLNIAAETGMAAMFDPVTGLAAQGFDPGAYTVADDSPFTQDQWDQYFQIGAPERLAYRSTFGTGGEGAGFEDPIEAQRRLVNLLALQRSGGGMYGGGSRMGQALLGRMGRLEEYVTLEEDSYGKRQ
jgi:hypothetical protein